MTSPQPLLSVNLSADYRHNPGVLRGVEFEIFPGEVFGLIGESGSGKSTVGLAILRLLEIRGGIARGSVRFEGRELMGLNERQLRGIRGLRMALVPQSPISALNPALRLETQFREAWSSHSRFPWRQAIFHVRDLLAKMGLPDDPQFLRRYPHQVSVGQAQRILIAMAVLHRPALLIADEPASALDPSSQHEVVALLKSLNRDFGMALLYISHDLTSVAELCTRAGVMDSGRLIACGSPEELWRGSADKMSHAPGPSAMLFPVNGFPIAASAPGGTSGTDCPLSGNSAVAV